SLSEIPAFFCRAHSLHPVTDSKLAVDSAYVVSDRLFRNTDPVRNFGIRQALDHGSQNLLLLPAQGIKPAWPGKLRGRIRGSSTPEELCHHPVVNGYRSAGHRADGRNEFLAGDALEQVTGSTMPQRVSHVFVILKGGEHDNMQVW